MGNSIYSEKKCPNCPKCFKRECYYEIINNKFQKPLTRNCWLNLTNRIKGIDGNCEEVCNETDNCLGHWSPSTSSNGITYSPIRFENMMTFANTTMKRLYDEQILPPKTDCNRFFSGKHVSFFE